MEKNYRYPGTRPFLEKDSHLFFGRTSDKLQLSELIVLENLVVLFGKSGYGKTSLLNAAVIPRLRRFEKHEVFSVRLKEAQIANHAQRGPLEILLEQLSSEAIGKTFLTEKLNITAELPENMTALIWYYAKLIQLRNKGSKAITLIFDQFEELDDFSEEQIEAFGRTIGKLLNLNAPKAVRKLIEQKLDANEGCFTKEEIHDLLKPLHLKVVFSLHHDRLNLLDHLKSALPTIFKYTYELKPLSEKQARNAFLKPAALAGEFASPEFNFTDEAANFIFKSLEDSKNHLIEPFQLQLIGQHAEEKIIAKKKKIERKAKFGKQKENQETSKFELGINDLDKPETIFKKHYNKVIAGLPFSKRRNVRKLVENVLIIGGRRVPMPEIVITSQHKVSKESLDDLVDKRLLRSELNTVQDTSFELSHDSLVKPILDSVEKRKQKRLWLLVILLGLLIAGLVARLALDYLSGSRIVEEEVEVSNGLIINAIATARALPFKGEAPLAVTFTFSEITPVGDVSVVRYHWEFGDGTARSDDNIPALQHTYKEPGEYTARLFVIGSDSLRHPPRTEDVTIIVEEPKPVVAINTIPSSGSAPLKIDFSATISEDITVGKYLWEFGDRFPSNEANPTHTFEHEGEYTVRLTIWDINNKKFTGSIPVNVINDNADRPIDTNSVPIARITASRYSGVAPMTVIFNGGNSTADESISSYYWEYNDGGFSEEVNPEYIFNTAGEYRVRLTVRDTEMKHHTETITISVFDAIPGINARVTADPTYGSVPLTVQFRGSNSIGNLTADSYLWEFNDGTVSREVNPVHTFTKPRIYNVRLTVRDADDETIYNEKIIRISALDSLKPPEPIIDVSHLNGTAPLEVKFRVRNASENSPESSYQWDFGDDSPISREQSPLHSFKDPGIYAVLLKVVGTAGREVSSGVNITVNPPLSTPNAQASASVLQGKVPLTVQFEGSDTAVNGMEIIYLWNFNDNNVTSDLPNPKHTFTEAGSYEIYLTVTDPQGAIANDTLQIIALPDKAPIAKINYKNILDGNLPLAVEFDATGSSDDAKIISYNWDFGDSQTSNDSIVLHTFKTAGTYEVKLKVVDDQNQPDETIVTITVCGENDSNAEAMAWMARFRSVQDQKLPSEVNSKKRWENWRIPPDSLNLVVILSDPDIANNSNENVQTALTFFFSKNKKNKKNEKIERKAYKFQNAVDYDESNPMYRSEQFNIKSLIKQAKKYAKNNEPTSIINTSESGDSFVAHKESIIQVLAELFEQENINNKTQNIYYTAFKSSDFDKDTNKDFQTILGCLAL